MKEDFKQPNPVRDEIPKDLKKRIEERDRSRIPLRIDDRTVILVHPDNANEEYASRKRAQMERSSTKFIYGVG